MREGRASRTAEYNAAFRPGERRAAPSRVLHDPYSDRLLPGGLRMLRRIAALRWWPRIVSFVDRRGRACAAPSWPAPADRRLAVGGAERSADQAVMLVPGSIRAPGVAGLARPSSTRSIIRAHRRRSSVAWPLGCRPAPRALRAGRFRRENSPTDWSRPASIRRKVRVVWDGVTNYLHPRRSMP